MHRRSVPGFLSVCSMLAIAFSSATPLNAQSMLEMMLEAQIEPRIERMRSVEPNLEIRFDLPADAPLEAKAIDAFQFNPSDGRFVARVIAADDAISMIQGRAELAVSAWVPVRRIQTGEIVQSSDVEERFFPVGLMNSGMLRDAKDIIGMEVRRPLQADRPVPDRAVLPPRAIRKGQPVEIRYTGGALEISSSGKALEDAATGDMVRVVNTSSNSIIHAEVTAPGIVRVGEQPQN